LSYGLFHNLLLSKITPLAKALSLAKSPTIAKALALAKPTLLRVVIYDRNMFIVQATGIIQLAKTRDVRLLGSFAPVTIF
jgi:hypothetical protein